MTSTASPSQQESRDVVARADELADAGRRLEAIDLLAAARTTDSDPAIDIRLAALRHAAFPEVSEKGFAEWPPATEPDESAASLPEVDADALDASTARRAILGRGGLLVRNLFTDHVDHFVAGIERSFEARSADDEGGRAWNSPMHLPRDEAMSLGRHFVAGDGAILACDSPRLLNDLLERYEQVGLRRVVSEYLGERPILSANKCTLRRVRLESGTDWHQDGAFLGAGIRVLNVWIALSDCGVDAPGLDLVPRRFDSVLETGTGGSYFDWSVGPEVVAGLERDTPVIRPSFKAGDAMLFDELFLHRTAIDDAMTRRRYAIESWFFAPSAYPDGQVPLVW